MCKAYRASQINTSTIAPPPKIHVIKMNQSTQAINPSILLWQKTNSLNMVSFANHCDHPVQYPSAKEKGKSQHLHNPRVFHSSHRDIGTYVVLFDPRSAQHPSIDDKRIQRSRHIHSVPHSSCNWSRPVSAPDPTMLEASSSVFHR